MASNNWNISNMNEIYEIKANISQKYMQAVGSLFVTITKPLNSKIRETFWLKWMYKLLEIDKPKAF